MLDQDLIAQLKEVFKPIKSPIELMVYSSPHADQKDLLDLLSPLEVCNENIKIKFSDIQHSPHPKFAIHANGKATGIIFSGIPGGHEFSSLVLAILNASGNGKFPDDFLKNRIKNLKGPIRLKTYISLSCENCPDVVQALNLMSLIHPDFQHEMIDGGYVQDEISKLGIQGVPSIVANDKLVNSGKIQLVDLITKLEETFGKNTNQPTESQDLGYFDVVVIGGGPAGASAAIYSARKGLKTVVLAERIGGQVQDTKGIENLVSVVYTEGPQLTAQLLTHMQAYPIQIMEHRRVKSILKGEKHRIELESGEILTTGSVIITTGAKWRELGVPGEKEYLGRGVAFCPHCDGPFYKGKKIAVVGGGNSGVEAAIDLAGIVREVVLLEFSDQLKADKVLVDKLKSLPNTSIVTNAKTSEILGDGQKVHQLRYQDRVNGQEQAIDLDGVFVQIGLVPNSQFVKDTVATSKFGEIIVDEKGRTNVKGIYAAGDVTTIPYKQIIIAMGEGAKAALAAFEDKMYSHS